MITPQKIGVIFGKFFPLHNGHIQMIETALQRVDMLYVFVCTDTERDQKLYNDSKMIKMPTPKDRLEWFKPLEKDYPKLIPILFNEDHLPPYPNGWQAWSERVKQTFKEASITPTLIFSSEPQDVLPYEKFFNLPVFLVDPDREKVHVSATKIRNNPKQYLDYVPDSVKPYLIKS